MSQKEINEAEWHDERNWHYGWLGVYYAPRDTRAWVPKRKPWYGWTVNFANRSGVLTLLLIMAVPIAISVLIAIGTDPRR